MLVATLATPVLADPPAQTFEDFENEGDTAGFGGGTGTYDNPGSGGVGGIDDGFLRISTDFETNFGAADFGEIFSGPDVDYIESGITGMTFWLNDVGEADDFEIHVSLGQLRDNIWTTTAGFVPGDNEWLEFKVDFTDESAWTRTHNRDSELTFQDAMRNVERILFRHDLPPFGQFPDQTDGDLGIDRIELTPEPTSVGLLLLGGLFALRRRRCPSVAVGPATR